MVSPKQTQDLCTVGCNITHFLCREVRQNAAYSYVTITTTSVKFSKISQQLKLFPLNRRKALPLIWKVQNDVHLTKMSSHYWSIFAPIRHRRGEASSQIVTRDETWVLHFETWHPEAMNGVVPHDNPKEEIQECVISRLRQSDIPVGWEQCYSFKVPAYGDDSEFSPQYYKFIESECLLRQVHPTTNISGVLLLHDSTRPHIKRAVYLPCCPDLITSHFCLLDPCKDSLWGHHDVDDRVLQNTVHQWPQGMEKVKEDSWRRCRLHSEIATPSATL